MCTIFATARDGRAIAELARSSQAGPIGPGEAEVTSGQWAPIIHNGPDGREAGFARWIADGFSPRDWPGQARLLSRSPGFGVAWRCVVPFSAFVAEGTRAAWFTISGAHPMACFAGIAIQDSFTLLRTTHPPGELLAVGSLSMPVVLATRAEINLWLNLPTEEALQLCVPLRTGMLLPEPSWRGVEAKTDRGHIPASWPPAAPATAPS